MPLYLQAGAWNGNTRFTPVRYESRRLINLFCLNSYAIRYWGICHLFTQRCDSMNGDGMTKQLGGDTMLKYATKRLLLLIPILLGVSIISFMLVRAMPGDAATAYLVASGIPPSEAAVKSTSSYRQYYRQKHGGHWWSLKFTCNLQHMQWRRIQPHPGQTFSWKTADTNPESYRCRSTKDIGMADKKIS